jgi:hypothetical protein
MVFDAAWRAGFTLEQLTAAAFDKLEINKKRVWVTVGHDEPIEHDRGEEPRQILEGLRDEEPQFLTTPSGIAEPRYPGPVI